MIAQNRRLNYLFRSGLVLFCLAGLLRLFVHPIPSFPASLVEGAIGFLYGLSAVLMLGGIVKNRNRRCDGHASPLEQK